MRKKEVEMIENSLRSRSGMVHEKENNQDTESFLKSNGDKFKGDCLTAMKLMYQGVRLNGDTCKELYGFSDRRLRNCIAARPDIVKKQWVLDGNGKRKYVEYWIEKIKPPTKESLQAWFTKYQQEQPTAFFHQPILF